MMTSKDARNMSAAQAKDLLDDILSLCTKILHDHDRDRAVNVEDLVELRDDINLVRTAVAGGAGYKAFAGRIRRA